MNPTNQWGELIILNFASLQIPLGSQERETDDQQTRILDDDEIRITD